MCTPVSHLATRVFVPPTKLIVAASVFAVIDEFGLRAGTQPHVIVKALRYLGDWDWAADWVVTDAAFDGVNFAKPAIANKFTGQAEAVVGTLLASGGNNSAGLLRHLLHCQGFFNS